VTHATLTAPMRCSALAEDLDEPMAGTTEQRVRWLLVEDRSAWGEKAVRDVLGRDLESAAKARGIRLLLVRRREADPAADAVRTAVLVDTERRRMARRSIRDPSELSVLLDAPTETFGEPFEEPIFLVCTNGRRDACCALRGRALAAAMAPEHGARTWECSHLGGHRFAGNLVCLPDGLVYGRVGPADGPRLADAFLRREVEARFLRGRAAWPPPAQAAEVALRTSLGRTGREEITLRSVTVAEDEASVELELQREVHRFALRAERLPPRPTSCRGGEPESPRHWRVVTG
jgi:hypothetical protein